MAPKNFNEANVIFAENQPEYMPIQALKIESPNGEVITCWELSFKERLKVLFSGEIWVSMLTFNKPLTPSFITTNKKDVIQNERV